MWQCSCQEGQTGAQDDAAASCCLFGSDFALSSSFVEGLTNAGHHCHLSLGWLQHLLDAAREGLAAGAVLQAAALGTEAICEHALGRQWQVMTAEQQLGAHQQSREPSDPVQR